MDRGDENRLDIILMNEKSNQHNTNSMHIELEPNSIQCGYLNETSSRDDDFDVRWVSISMSSSTPYIPIPETWKKKTIRFGYYTPKRSLYSTNTPPDGEPKAFDTIYPDIKYLVWNVEGQFRYHIQHGRHGKANFSSTYARSMQTRLLPFRKSRRWRPGWLLTGHKQTTRWGGERPETNRNKPRKGLEVGKDPQNRGR